MNKKYIIRKNKEIQEIILINKKIKSNYFIIFYSKKLKLYNRYCISVSKKIGNAVTRNYIRRKIKDILIKNSIKNNYDCVIIVRKSVLDLDYTVLKEKILEQIGEIK